MKHTGIYNRIWLPVALVLTVLLSIVSFKGLYVQAMALEQQARCGIEEHIHSDGCYINGRFICDTPVHTHTENCYLVLLKDNDINILLTQIEKQPDNALETVIEHSVDSALQLNQNLTSPLASEDILSSNVAAINETIEEYDIQPQVTLNENLYTSYGGYDGDLPQDEGRSQIGTLSSGLETGLPEDPLAGSIMMMAAPSDPLSAGNNDISLLSLDDPVQTGSGKANYYVYLDDTWRTVGYLTFSTSKRSNRYSAYQGTSNVTKLYNESLGLTSSLTNSDMNLYYATSPTSSSWTAATVSGNNTYYGTNYSQQNTARAAKYVRLMDASGNPLAFYSVTFQYADGSEDIQYVRSGEMVLLPEGVTWTDDAGEYAGGTQVQITSASVFAEKAAPSIATYYIYLNNGWRSVGTLEFSATKMNTTYRAVQWTTDIVDLYNQTFDVGLTTTGLTLYYATSATSDSWTKATSSGSNTYFGTNYNTLHAAKAEKHIRLVDTDGTPLAYYTVTLRYMDGTETTQHVRSGSVITLPQGNVWKEDTTEYAGGEQVSVYSARTFTEEKADERLRISYNVNFPAVSGVTITTQPTLLGSAETQLTDIIELETDARIRNVSQQNVVGSVNGNAVGLSRVVGFMGWQIEGTDTILSANATLTWAELQSYVGTGQVLKLQGVWEYRAQQTASFYIRYDSVAVDTEGNMTSQDSNLYTPELFAAFVGGEDSTWMSDSELNKRYYIADTTSDNSYGADQEIRSLYGQTSGVWLQSFPKDEDIFEQLKAYASHLQVDGEPVDVNDLNKHAYTIRWYVFKCQYDAWHIDGRLVKKEGLFDVAKSFAGNKEAIAEAMDGFYITASNSAGDKRYYLYLDEPMSYPQDGTVLIPSFSK